MAARKRLARLAIGAHPPGWRRRYAEEVLALVAAAGVTWRHAFDLLRSAAWPFKTMATTAAPNGTALTKPIVTRSV